MNQNNPHLAPRTIREWLELIPFDRARKEAIENLDEFKSDLTMRTLSASLFFGFNWDFTFEKYRYWERLYWAIIRMEQSVKLKNR
jgi:hypothetical protein